MYSLLLFTLLLLVVIYVLSSYRSWRRNIAVATAAGWDFVSAPVFMGNFAWLVGSFVLMPIFRRLPQAWTSSWIDVIEPSWPYVSRFEPFKRLGEIIKVVSPGGLYMNFANAEAVSQICDRRHDFQKPLEVYEMIAIFGPNVVTTEGHVWREHRKATAQAFSEKNNALVWEESLRQARGMITNWASEDTSSVDSMTVQNVQSSSETLSLHIISKAGFGVRLFWPWEHGDASKNNGLAQFSAEIVPPGHKMTHKVALRTMLENLHWLASLPPWVLRTLPFQSTRKAVEAKAECGRYWEELIQQKIAEVRSGVTEKDSMDLMYLLVKAAGIASSETAGADVEPSPLSATEVIGNAYIFTVAGHETTADSIQYIILGLAMNRSAQSHLQNDLDLILGNKPPENWDYFKDFDRLFGSMLGAVVSEGLRLMPPVLLIPKTARVGEQSLSVDGRNVVVPRGTFIHINVFALHRNPRYWPHRPSKRTNEPHDLNDYIPERWLPQYQSYETGRFHKEEMKVTNPQKSSTGLFTPTRGAFIPFNEGHRSCLGRRFALVELVAVVAFIFKSYSVELAVDEWATDEQVKRMTKPERQMLYEKAVNRAYWKLEKGCESILTLKLKKGNEIPVRFVKRGKERFPLEE